MTEIYHFIKRLLFSNERAFYYCVPCGCRVGDQFGDNNSSFCHHFGHFFRKVTIKTIRAADFCHHGARQIKMAASNE